MPVGPVKDIGTFNRLVDGMVPDSLMFEPEWEPSCLDDSSSPAPHSGAPDILTDAKKDKPWVALVAGVAVQVADCGMNAVQNAVGSCEDDGHLGVVRLVVGGGTRSGIAIRIGSLLLRCVQLRITGHGGQALNDR